MQERTRIEKVAAAIVVSAVEIHQALGPGLLESAYQACMVYELEGEGWKVKKEVKVPVVYKGIRINAGYRLDLLVDDRVIVENKTVGKLLPIHKAQLLTYLRLTGCRLGFLLNWHVPIMKDGIKRMVLNL